LHQAGFFIFLLRIRPDWPPFPPKNIDEFTREVFIAEGLDPAASERRLLTAVRNLVAEAFVDCAPE